MTEPQGREDEPRKFHGKIISDPEELRALSHPLRQRLLAELYARRQGSVSQLAEAVGEPVNKVSYHLRQLAKYGLLEPAPEFARDGRDRWWRLAYPDGIDFSPELTASSPGRAAIREYSQGTLGQTLTEIQGYFESSESQRPPGFAFGYGWYLRLTQDEAKQFNDEHKELCLRWRDRGHAEEATESPGSTDRRTYAVHLHGFPVTSETGADEGSA